MYFNDRIALGEMLADKLKDFRNKDTILICLKEESLLTCLSMAMYLRAWVYPLAYEPVHDTAMGMQLVGALDQTGNFILHPSLESDKTAKANAKQLALNQKTSAVAAIEERLAAYDMVFDANQLSGRNIVLVCDILTDILPLAVAEHILPRTSIKSLAIAIGNATPGVSELAQVSADKVIVLDIISGITASTDPYFNQPDSYSDAQKHTLTKHIATYWQ